MCGNIFKVMVFTLLENTLNLGIFTHLPIPYSKIQAEFFENLFPAKSKGCVEKYDLLYQNSIRKHEDELEQ